MEAIERCMDFFERPGIGIRIVTDGVSVEQVAERIAGACALRLPPERRGFRGRFFTVRKFYK